MFQKYAFFQFKHKRPTPRTPQPTPPPGAECSEYNFCEQCAGEKKPFSKFVFFQIKFDFFFYL